MTHKDSVSSATTWLTVPILLVKLHYLLLVPWIVFSVPMVLTLGQPLLMVVGLVSLGVFGMFTGRRKCAIGSSIGVLLLLVLGRVIGDVYRLEPSDTSVLLLQFVAIIFLLEASLHVLAFESDRSRLPQLGDEWSEDMTIHVQKWLRSQLSADITLGLGTFLLSLGLLVLGGFAGIQVDHVAVLAILVLASVVALLFLLTYQRESEPSRKKY